MKDLSPTALLQAKSVFSALTKKPTTKIEQNFDKVSISKDTDETGAIYLHIEAKTPGRIPDVEPEKDPNSGFNADVNDWGKEENTELPL